MKHRQVWDMIPWLVNGSLPHARRAGLQHHIDTCAECRAEIEAQRQLMQAMNTRPQVESMPHVPLQKLWERIDSSTPAAAPSARQPPATPSRLVGWLAAATIVQALLLGALSWRLFWSPQETGGETTYQTVSSPSPAPPVASVRAVFAPDMTLGELQALLERARLRIIDGPTPEGVYTLATASARDDPRQALLTLRSHPAARFAEPIGR
jgi:hypothetical protein